MANPIDWASGVVAIVKAVIEYIKAKFYYDAGKKSAKLEGLENAQDALDVARHARSADSVPEELDPDNRRNK